MSYFVYEFNGQLKLDSLHCEGMEEKAKILF